jgi:folylpolyglutamate synthase/dihydropteroate synthase
LAAAGRHQHDNAQLAVALALEAVAAGWLPRLDATAVHRALENLVWPGRLTTHTVRGREVLVDCAHNLEAALMLSEYLASSQRKYNLLFGCLDDKPVERMARALGPRLGDVVVVELEDERAMGLERMLGAFPGAVPAASIADGLDRLRDPVLAAGSLRLVGALLALEDPLEGQGP